MINLLDFIDAVHRTYENHYGDLAPFSKQDITDVYDLLDGDDSANAIMEAFEEAELTTELSEEFFDDLSMEMREMEPEPF